MASASMIENVVEDGSRDEECRQNIASKTKKTVTISDAPPQIFSDQLTATEAPIVEKPVKTEIGRRGWKKPLTAQLKERRVNKQAGSPGYKTTIVPPPPTAFELPPSVLVLTPQAPIRMIDIGIGQPSTRLFSLSNQPSISNNTKRSYGLKAPSPVTPSASQMERALQLEFIAATDKKPIYGESSFVRETSLISFKEEQNPEIKPRLLSAKIFSDRAKHLLGSKYFSWKEKYRQTEQAFDNEQQLAMILRTLVKNSKQAPANSNENKDSNGDKISIDKMNQYFEDHSNIEPDDVELSRSLSRLSYSTKTTPRTTTNSAKTQQPRTSSRAMMTNSSRVRKVASALVRINDAMSQKQNDQCTFYLAPKKPQIFANPPPTTPNDNQNDSLLILASSLPNVGTLEKTKGQSGSKSPLLATPHHHVFKGSTVRQPGSMVSGRTSSDAGAVRYMSLSNSEMSFSDNKRHFNSSRSSSRGNILPSTRSSMTLLQNRVRLQSSRAPTLVGDLNGDDREPLNENDVTSYLKTNVPPFRTPSAVFVKAPLQPTASVVQLYHQQYVAPGHSLTAPSLKTTAENGPALDQLKRPHTSIPYDQSSVNRQPLMNIPVPQRPNSVASDVDDASSVADNTDRREKKTVQFEKTLDSSDGQQVMSVSIAY